MNKISIPTIKNQDARPYMIILTQELLSVKSEIDTLARVGVATYCNTYIIYITRNLHWWWGLETKVSGHRLPCSNRLQVSGFHLIVIRIFSSGYRFLTVALTSFRQLVFSLYFFTSLQYRHNMIDTHAFLHSDVHALPSWMILKFTKHVHMEVRQRKGHLIIQNVYTYSDFLANGYHLLCPYISYRMQVHLQFMDKSCLTYWMGAQSHFVQYTLFRSLALIWHMA